MYCKNIQGCKNEVQQLNLYWFAFCIVTYRNLSAAKSILLGIHVHIMSYDTNVRQLFLQKTLNAFASTMNNCEVIMNTYYNHFLEGICLNTMKCHWTSLKRLSVLLYQHWLNTMSWLNFFPKFCMLQTSY